MEAIIFALCIFAGMLLAGGPSAGQKRSARRKVDRESTEAIARWHAAQGH